MTTKTTPLTLEKVKEIAKTYPTPFVIYDKKAIVENMQEFKEAFSWVN
jgi:diaminopimelate decarboxylase